VTEQDNRVTTTRDDLEPAGSAGDPAGDHAAAAPGGRALAEDVLEPTEERPEPADAEPTAAEATEPEATDPEATGPEATDPEATGPLAADDPRGEPSRTEPRAAAAAGATPSRSPYRTAAFAVARAAIVVAVSAVVYQAVIPSTHTITSRLGRLVISEPGVAGYNIRPVNSAVEPASETNLAALVSDAKRYPGHTGEYAIEWAPTETQGIAVFAYLLPNDAQATALMPEVRTEQMGQTSYTSNGLTRHSTYTAAAIPGSIGALYTQAPKADPTFPLAITAFRSGRVVVLAEAETPTATLADANATATNELAHLRQVEPGFTLQVVRRPLAPTILWGVGTLILAAFAALGPIARRRLAERRQRRLEEELSHLVVVGGRAVATKHRR
jgi:hypothetical protein